MELSTTILIIIGTCVFSILGFNNRQLLERFLMKPYAVKHANEWHRTITAGFLHADWGHLAFNMIALYFFGELIELFLSPLHLIAVFLIGVLMGNLTSMPKHGDNPYYKALGASGGVAAVLFCSIIFFPTNELIIFPIPIPIPAYIFAPLYLIYSHYQGKRGVDNIGHEAHLYGALSGIAYALFANPSEALLFVDKIMSSL